MKISKALCNRLAAILGGTGMSDGKSCSIMVERKLNARVLGRKYETEHEITIQSLQNGTTGIIIQRIPTLSNKKPPLS